MNKAILIGTVDETPRVHQTGGRTRLTLKLRTVDSYFDENGVERERRSWHDVVVWGRRGEALAPILVKGKSVAVEGRIVHTSWDGTDGRRRYRTEIHAHDILLLGRRESAPGAAADERAA